MEPLKPKLFRETDVWSDVCDAGFLVRMLRIWGDLMGHIWRIVGERLDGFQTVSGGVWVFGRLFRGCSEFVFRICP